MSGAATAEGGFSQLAARIGAPSAVASLAFPLVVVAAGVAAGVLQADRMIGAWSVRLWLLALAASTASGVVSAIRGRRAARALGLLAVAAVLVQVLAWAALRLDGTVSAGVGEARAPWEANHAGPLATVPSIEVLELPTVPDEPARLRVDGRDLTVPLGLATRVDAGTSLVVHGPFPAPSFEVLRHGGDRVEAGLVKVDPGARDWFMVQFLPHRLYLSAPEGGIGPDPRSPERLHLRVQRGKLRVLDRDITPGERVPFERHSFMFSPGEVWARVEVRRRPPAWPGLALAAALGCGALALGWSRRRVRS